VPQLLSSKDAFTHWPLQLMSPDWQTHWPAKQAETFTAPGHT
jgi:hypothetical protein